MATDNAALEVVISADVKELKEGLAYATSEVKKFSDTTTSTLKKMEQQISKLDVLRQFKRNIEDIGSSLNSLGKTFSFGLTAPITAIGASFLSAAASAQELQNRFQVSFAQTADSTEDFFQTLSGKINRSTIDLKQYATTFQSTFKPLGYGTEEAAKFSKELTQLAVDLGSFYDQEDADVVRDIQSAIVGQTETIRKYGVVITETSIAQEAMRQGMNKTYYQLTEQEKVWLRYSLILQNTRDAQGDAERTAGSYTNQLKGLKSAIQELSVEFGTNMIPLATELVGELKNLSKSYTSLDESTQSAIIKFVAITAAIGPFIIVLGSAATAIGGLISFVGLLIPLIVGLTGPIGVLTVAIVAIGAAILNSRNELMNFNKNLLETQDIIGNGKWKEHEADVRNLADSYNKMKEEAKDLGMEMSVIEDDFGTSAIFKQTAKLEETAKRLGISVSELKKKQLDLAFSSNELVNKIRDNYSTMENFNKVILDVNTGIRQQSRELQVLNQYSNEFGENARKNVQNMQAEVASLTTLKKQVNDAATVYQYLATVKNKNAQQSKDMAQIEAFLTEKVGKGAIMLNKSTGAFVLNKKAIDNFNVSTAKAIALTENDIVLNIRTNITQGTQEVEDLKSKIRQTEKELQMGGLTESEKSSLRSRIVELKKYQQSVLKENESNGRQLAEQSQKTIDNILKQLSGAEKGLKANAKAGESAAEKAARLLREKIQNEIALINFRYSTEQKTQAETIKALQANLKKYASYYKANLTEELSLRQQIWQMQNEMAKKQIEEQKKLAEKANDAVIKKLEKREDALDKMHNKELKRIEDEKDAKIKAIDDQIEAQERMLDSQRQTDRLKEIEAVIDAYKASTTMEGQARYKELLQEKQDINLDINKQILEDEKKRIEETANTAKEQENIKYEAQKEGIEKQKELIEKNYESLLNKIQGITDKATPAVQKKLDEFANVLVKGTQKAYDEAMKSIGKTTNTPVVSIPKAEKTPLITELPKITTDLTVPTQATTGAVYNITNNTTNNININVQGAGSPVETANLVAEQLNTALKEVI